MSSKTVKLIGAPLNGQLVNVSEFIDRYAVAIPPSIDFKLTDDNYPATIPPIEAKYYLRTKVISNMEIFVWEDDIKKQKK